MKMPQSWLFFCWGTEIEVLDGGTSASQAPGNPPFPCNSYTPASQALKTIRICAQIVSITFKRKKLITLFSHNKSLYLAISLVIFCENERFAQWIINVDCTFLDVHDSKDPVTSSWLIAKGTKPGQNENMVNKCHFSEWIWRYCTCMSRWKYIANANPMLEPTINLLKLAVYTHIDGDDHPVRETQFLRLRIEEDIAVLLEKSVPRVVLTTVTLLQGMIKFTLENMIWQRIIVILRTAKLILPNIYINQLCDYCIWRLLNTYSIKYM